MASGACLFTHGYRVQLIVLRAGGRFQSSRQVHISAIHITHASTHHCDHFTLEHLPGIIYIRYIFRLLPLYRAFCVMLFSSAISMSSVIRHKTGCRFCEHEEALSGDSESEPSRPECHSGPAQTTFCNLAGRAPLSTATAKWHGVVCSHVWPLFAPGNIGNCGRISLSQ